MRLQQLRSSKSSFRFNGAAQSSLVCQNTVWSCTEANLLTVHFVNSSCTQADQGPVNKYSMMLLIYLIVSAAIKHQWQKENDNEQSTSLTCIVFIYGVTMLCCNGELPEWKLLISLFRMKSINWDNILTCSKSFFIWGKSHILDILCK